MKTSVTVSACLIVSLAATLAAPPQVSNIRASQRAGTKLIDILYDVSDAENDPLTIVVQISSDSGSTYGLPVYSTSGDIGSGVTPGANKAVVWNAGQDWNRRFTNTAKARVLADDTPVTPPVSTMAFVPAGFSYPASAVEVFTSSFYMDKMEVTKDLWQTVKDWGSTHNYTFIGNQGELGSSYPVTGIIWRDAVIWCNARSEMEGLTPVYYTDLAQTQVARTGEVLDNNYVAWTANGHRLPTRAEWLKAYWGGLAPYKSATSGNYYPWPSMGGGAADFISTARGNYHSSGGYLTTTVGTYPANGFGLYDMFGNVGEWCWDRDFTNWYSLVEAKDDNSKGPNVGTGLMRYFSGLHAIDTSHADFYKQIPVSLGSAYSYTANNSTSAYGVNGTYTAVGLRTVRSR